MESRITPLSLSSPSDDITSLANKFLLFIASSYISTASEQSQDIMHFSPHGQAAHKVFFYLLLCNIVFLLLNNIFVPKKTENVDTLDEGSVCSVLH